MKAHLILLASLALSFYCLRKDAKLQKDVSPAIWLVVIWMMRCGSRSFVLWFHGGGDVTQDSDAGLLDPIILLGLTLLGVSVLIRRGVRLQALFRENAWLIVFLAYLTVSVLWSDDLFTSFKRWVRAAGDVTMALIVATELAPFAALVAVIRRSTMVLIPLSLVLCKYFPDLGRLTSKSWSEPDAWIGVANDKNWLGVLCFLAAACFLWNWVMRKRETGLGVDIRLFRIPFELPFLAISLFLLYGGGRSKSMTAIILFGFSIVLFLALDYCRKKNIRFLPWAVTILIAWLLLNGFTHLIAGASLTDLGIEAMGRNPNLTDRADFWPFLIQKGMEHPVFGAGFASFWTPEIAAGVKEIIHISPNQAHNGYLEVFLNTGIVGLSFLVLALYGSLKGAYRLMQQNFEAGRFRLILLLCVMLDNWTEASFGRPTQLVWLVFLFGAINVIPGPEYSSPVAGTTGDSDENPVLEPFALPNRMACA